MKFQISFVPNMTKESYRLMRTEALDKYAAELVERLRGPVGYLDVYEMMQRLDDEKFRIANREFMEFMTKERWTEYIKAFVAEVVSYGMTDYSLVECSKILESINVDYHRKAFAIVELEIPDDFLKEENLEYAVFRDVHETHESRLNALWKDSCVAKYSKACVSVV